MTATRTALLSATAIIGGVTIASLILAANAKRAHANARAVPDDTTADDDPTLRHQTHERDGFLTLDEASTGPAAMMQDPSR